MNTGFQYQDINKRVLCLEQDVSEHIRLIHPIAYESLMQKLEAIHAESKLKIAFIGQYDSGKSTIISALTGERNIKISSDVETDVPASYQYEDVILTDTPGLKAGVRKEHDMETLKVIYQSDLIVYCITSSLFDDITRNDFIDLAYNGQYKNKIFLLVNKMSQEAPADVEQYENYQQLYISLVHNYAQSIEDSINGGGGNDVDFQHRAFVDAKDYIDGIDSNDQELIDNSHFTYFIEELNQFVSNTGALAKLCTPCLALKDCIQTEISETGTEFDKNLMTVLRQAEACLRKHKSDTKEYELTESDRIVAIVMKDANELISSIGAKRINDNVCKSLNEKIQNALDIEVEAIRAKLNSIQEDTLAEMQGIWDSEIATSVFSQLNAKGININATTLKNLNWLKDIYSGTGKVAGKVAEMAGKGAESGAKIVAAAGTKLHKAVLAVGHFFGKSFKPWEAVGVASKLGKAAKALGPAISALGVVTDIVDIALRNQHERKIKAAKMDAYNQYHDISESLVSEVHSEFGHLYEDFFDKNLSIISETRSGHINDINTCNKYIEDMKSLNVQVESLIDNIYSLSNY